MRMTEREAALTTARQIQELMRAWNEGQHREWERTRWMAWQQMLLSPNIKQADKPRTAQAFMRFPWEQPEEIDMERIRVSEEEAAKLNAIFDEIHRNAQPS